MDSSIFSFGETVLSVVAPVFKLFIKEGFAPFLATAMLAVTVALGLSIYIGYFIPHTLALRKVLKRISIISSQQEFSKQFNEINEAFLETSSLKHGWQEFCETLVQPDPQDQVQVIRNTIRPVFYLNTHDIEVKMHLKTLHFVSNLLVGIGLLLTFIGLVAALTFASCGISNLETSTKAIVKLCSAIGADINGGMDKSIINLLHAASLKFWTSVAGLGCSILLRIAYEMQHNRLKTMIRNINAALEAGLHFVTPEYLAIENLREAREQSAAMRRFSSDLAVSLAKDIQSGFSIALSPVQESLRDLGERITGGIGEAVKGAAGSEMQQLAKNMGGIVESLNTSRTEMEGVGANFRSAMTEAAQAMKTASGQASDDMSQKLQDVMTSLAEESRKQARMFDDSMSRLAAVMDQAGDSAGQTMREAAGNLASGMNGVSDGVRDAAGAMAERMTQLSGVLETIEQRMNTHVQTMDSLTGRARETEQAMGATSRHLTDAAAPVTQATNKMAVTAEQMSQSMQTAQKTIGESHQQLTGLAAKMGDTQQILQTAWQAYEQRFAGVDENLAKALQGIVDNVQNNIQSLETFVRDVDQKLAAAVTLFGSSINELNDTAENFEDASTKLLQATDRLTREKTAA